MNKVMKSFIIALPVVTMMACSSGPSEEELAAERNRVAQEQAEAERQAREAEAERVQAEAAQLEAEISRISDTTSWGGINLLDSSLSDGITFQAGTKEGDTIVVSIPDMAATAATIAIEASFTMGSFANAQSYITAVDAAIAGVSDVRGKLGAVSNRLNSTIANMDQVRVNLASSRGRIEDTDFATETGNLARAQILQQAATAMLAQANASQSSVLSLLRG